MARQDTAVRRAVITADRVDTKLARLLQADVIAFQDAVFDKSGFFAFLTGLGAREFGAVVITAILRETPLEVTVIVMLLLAAVTSRNDLNTFAYIHTFYLPIIIAPGLAVPGTHARPNPPRH